MNIEWSDLGTAFGLMLIFEGLLPFMSPNQLKSVYMRVSILEGRIVRVIGFGCMMLGLMLLSVARH